MSGQRNRNLTDSQKELAAIIVDELEGKTPTVGTPVRSSDSETSMYRIAEEVEGRSEATRWVRCENHGPAFKLGRRMDTFETVQNRHENFINQYLGEQKFKRFVMPLLIGFIGSAAGVGLMALVFRGLIAGVTRTQP